MKIDIIGAGSIGLLLAGRLIHAGQDVRIWCRSKEQAEALNKDGLSLSSQNGAAPIVIPGTAFFASCANAFAGTYLDEPGDWVVLTLKQQALHQELPEILAPLYSSTLNVVCFQNGYGHLQKLRQLLPNASVWAAVTTDGAKRETSTEVIHTGRGEIYIGQEDDGHTSAETDGLSTAAARSFTDALLTAGFSASMSNKVNTLIYRKLLINAVINPLTAIWRIQNGELLSSSQRVQLMKDLYAEAVAVYDVCGVTYEEDAWEHILEVCRATSDNISSMLADVLASRETEIRWINGSIVEMAERRGIQVPLHRWICRLVEGMSARER
ncbi:MULTISPECIES: 2-dehydropantoate 2-reductase [unclassified Paenibacillus]|uniref:ketopantoate reductase family protein n=1 Tax=unclassified Paenibacillus TaxID=185978 RepID=UPI0024066B3F|nr:MULTISPECIES: 2-dehydropantoate 2-reductase [unclassified Paenibacillus]MDF9843231.1 2-dehydropantoate 2-reductase [Paenibacillus sp. PastF-2]MDF9849819.1 2-dehydropantoate 2-reductase [Paenibacillus sp. PastM-2]MDF9856526.1 2-dehydropantoate 2-reductase [Paenibacillus sp. PastF-1]MDH6481796.1 2-dehydropantoate 2-reductase [Paenibacillus sp. PastH-2]MDH6509114.1 2-dehydropantoate 2-reductase [Paenibacillus sp. PastM-3]